MHDIKVGLRESTISIAVPRHVVVVPNGNRRRAQLRGIDLNESYVRGALNALEVIGWAKDAGVTDVTLFGLSCENKDNRPDDQLEALAEGADFFCDHVTELDCKVHVFGKYAELQAHAIYSTLYEKLQVLNEKNAAKEFTVHVAVNYSGMLQHETDPLFDAIRLHGIEEVEKNREKYVLSAGVPKADLFIRTGGEYRTSGLLPFQVGYAEIKIFDAYWGDFTREMFDEALRWYGMQPRNFGK